MCSNMDEHDPVANLHLQPTRSILKSTKSLDDAAQDSHQQETASPINHSSTTGMTRSESRSRKIPHFDEMNIIATYHPVDKDYGHMKIEEPKTPYAPNDMIDEEMDADETKTIGIDPSTLAQRLNESDCPSTNPIHLHIDRSPSRSIEDDAELSSEEIEHRKKFEQHRKQHYNEFEVVRQRKKEIEEELRALEQDEEQTSTNQNNEKVFSQSTESIKPILIHHSSTPSHHHASHHVQVEDDHEDDHTLTPEERERKRQFELKRKKHYNEFRAARLADQDDDEENNNTS